MGPQPSLPYAGGISSHQIQVTGFLPTWAAEGEGEQGEVPVRRARRREIPILDGPGWNLV